MPRYIFREAAYIKIMNILIIGGYGTFGYGIADLLSNEAELSITIAGRDFGKPIPLAGL